MIVVGTNVVNLYRNVPRNWMPRGPAAYLTALAAAMFKQPTTHKPINAIFIPALNCSSHCLMRAVYCDS